MCPDALLPLRPLALRDSLVRSPLLLASCPVRLPPMLPAPHTLEAAVRSTGLELHGRASRWRRLHACALGWRRLHACALRGGEREEASRMRVGGGGGGFTHARWGGGGFTRARWTGGGFGVQLGPRLRGTGGLLGPGSSAVTRAHPPPCRGPVRAGRRPHAGPEAWAAGDWSGSGGSSCHYFLQQSLSKEITRFGSLVLSLRPTLVTHFTPSSIVF